MNGDLKMGHLLTGMPKLLLKYYRIENKSVLDFLLIKIYKSSMLRKNLLVKNEKDKQSILFQKI